MSESARNLLERALALTEVERLELAHELLESVGDVEEERGELSPAWIVELERRVREVVAGRGGPTEDWRVVLDRIRPPGP